jgi:hypothetical protein
MVHSVLQWLENVTKKHHQLWHFRVWSQGYDWLRVGHKTGVTWTCAWIARSQARLLESLSCCRLLLCLRAVVLSTTAMPEGGEVHEGQNQIKRELSRIEQQTGKVPHCECYLKFTWLSFDWIDWNISSRTGYSSDLLGWKFERRSESC